MKELENERKKYRFHWKSVRYREKLFYSCMDSKSCSHFLMLWVLKVVVTYGGLLVDCSQTFEVSELVTVINDGWLWKWLPKISFSALTVFLSLLCFISSLSVLLIKYFCKFCSRYLYSEYNYDYQSIHQCQ